MQNYNIFEKLCCCSCGSDYAVEILSGNLHAIKDAVIKCERCGVTLAVVDGMVINTYTLGYKLLVDQFNVKYGLDVELTEHGTGYHDFVKDSQISNEKNFVSWIKKFLAIFYYHIVLLGVYLLLFPRKKSDNNSTHKLVDLLSEHYCYVPEMALQKLVELQCLQNNFPASSIGMVADFGGGNGVVFDILLDGKSADFRLNIDLFGSQSNFYDLVLCEDLAATSLKDNSVDTLVSICVVEHIPRVDKLFDRFCKILKGGGLFLFTTPKVDYYKYLFFYRFLGLLNSNLATKYAKFDLAKSYHVSLYEQRHIVDELVSVGFTSVKVVPFYSDLQLFIYDLINLPAKLPASFHFWKGLQLFLMKNRYINLI